MSYQFRYFNYILQYFSHANASSAWRNGREQVITSVIIFNPKYLREKAAYSKGTNNTYLVTQPTDPGNPTSEKQMRMISPTCMETGFVAVYGKQNGIFNYIHGRVRTTQHKIYRHRNHTPIPGSAYRISPIY
ncbi:hypothetical protein I7I50_09485 [Histoplasma capsulatum G186AR]|uniref:Uncharacterized protein n=1 Tax=Ajellomyces capsulatus TaxID=5037 RepID=A0A8H8D0B8_AJECA|nr:hypothetical protein I7I52_07006 [Histoplasma capsulatum]QSS74357.1 hypothetical protein I7I50_09485 [Histoplasma capsulatum G186AR]